MIKDISVRGHLKTRINEILRCKIILDNYCNKTLKNTEFNENHLNILSNSKKECINIGRNILSNVSGVVKREFKIDRFEEPIELVLSLANSNEFFEIKDLLNEVLDVYEKNFSVLVDRFNINPLDRIRFYKLKFI